MFVQILNAESKAKPKTESMKGIQGLAIVKTYWGEQQKMLDQGIQKAICRKF